MPGSPGSSFYSKLACVSDPLTRYRIHPDQYTGIASLTFYQQLQRRRREPSNKFEAWSNQFEELRNRWITRPGDDFEKCLNLIEGRIAFSRSRAELPSNPWLRACKVLGSASSYGYYASGLNSMLRDIFIPAVSRSRERT